MNRLELKHICYSYDGKNKVLDDVNYTFEDRKIYAIVGRSGAGKTTLLSLLSQLCTPTSGEIFYEEKNISCIDPYLYRSRYVGVIFQSFNLLPQLTAIENVRLSMDIAGIRKNDRNAHAKELLEQVGLREEEIERRVLRLSGGQQQRVAIARALSYNPSVILADEPTGNLDVDTQAEIMEIFRRLAYEEGKCILLVTHSDHVAQCADVIYTLETLKKQQKS